MSFRPVEDEKRARIGVLGFVKWGAKDREAALGVGVKVPRRRRPLACAERILSDLVCATNERFIWRESTDLGDSFAACQKRRAES